MKRIDQVLPQVMQDAKNVPRNSSAVSVHEQASDLDLNEEALPIVINELQRTFPTTLYHKDAQMFRSHYPTPQAFFRAYNADILKNVLKIDRNRVFRGAAPDLYTTKEAMGIEYTALWIELLLFNLSEYVGTKEKLPEQKAYQLALTIINEYPYLKLSEFAYFITQIMVGRYGVFYGVVDPLVITTALRAFVKDRDAILFRLECQKQNAT